MAETLKDKTAKGLFWGAVSNGGMQAMNIIIGIFLARMLTPTDYGLVGMITIFTVISTTLGESGFTQAIVNKKDATDNDYNAVFWFSTLIGIVLYTLLFILAPCISSFFQQEELTPLSRISFLSIILCLVGTAPHIYLYKNMIVKQTTFLRLSAIALSGSVSIIMAYCDLAYWSLVVQNLMYVGITSIGKFFLVPWRPILRIDFSPLKPMFKFSSKILATSLLSQICSNILTVILGRLFPVKLVGYYTQSNKWSSMAGSFIAGTITQIAHPVLATANEDSNRQLRITRKLVRFTSLLAFPLMLGLSMISHEFIVITIGEKWNDCAVLLRILCIGAAFTPLHLLFQQVVISRKRSDLYLITNIILFVMQILLVILLNEKNIIYFVSSFTALNIMWMIVWQQICQKLIGYSFLDTAKDVIPFVLIASVSVLSVYFVTSGISILIIRLLSRLLLTAGLYLLLLKITNAKILEECISYIKQKHTQSSHLSL